MKQAPNGKLSFCPLTFALALLFAVGATYPTTASELQRLQGTWEGLMVGDTASQKVTVTITNDTLHFHRDTNFWFETTFTVPAGKDPHELHATIKRAAPSQGSSNGTSVIAIFKIADGTLTLVPLVEGAEMPKTFESLADDKQLARYELRKVPPPKKDSELPKPK